MDFKVLIADSAIADLKPIVEFLAEDMTDERLVSTCATPLEFSRHEQSGKTVRQTHVRTERR